MLIDHAHEFIFVHIRKTGGTSIGTSLVQDRGGVPGHHGTYAGGLCIGHSSSVYIKRTYPVEWQQFFTFSFVRNPWDRLVSRYFWSKNAQKALLEKECATFERFVQRIKDQKPLFGPEFSSWNSGHNLYHTRESILATQYDQLYDESGKQLVDYVGKFERLQEDFDIICDKIGVSRRKLPHENKAKHTPYWACYSDESRSIVAELYKNDIEHFGYEFKG